MNTKNDAQLARHDKAKDYQREAEQYALQAVRIAREAIAPEEGRAIKLILIAVPLASLLEARDQLEELKKLLPDVGFVTCIYCGFKAKAKDEADKLADHITSCDKNPVLQMCKEACDKLELSEANVIAVSEECEILRADLTAEKQAHRECHAGMVAELEKVNGELAKIKARNVINAIKQICEVCGHTNTEDGCAFCISEKLTALHQSSGALYNWIQDNDMSLPQSKAVMKKLQNELFDELDKGVKEGKR